MPRATLPTVLIAIALRVSSPDGTAQEAIPPRTAEEVVLSTKTPLGEASIVLPANSAVTDYDEEGAMMLLRQGPFAARVPREEIIFVTNATAFTTAPEEPAPLAAEQAAPMPEPEQSINQTNPAPAAHWPDLPAEWKKHWPVAAIALLGSYSLFATFALLRTRGRRAQDSTRPRPVLPAVVTGNGHSIACPLCGKDIAVATLESGRNSCPACQGAFVVERP